MIRLLDEAVVDRFKGLEMGRFTVELELANNDDLAGARARRLAPASVRRVRVEAVVDSGAVSLVVPGRVATHLGLRQKGKTRVRYADRRAAVRDVVGDIELTFAGRTALFDAIVEPRRKTVLLGAIVMEALDLIVDCSHQRLVPRDPKYIISEIE